MISNKRKEIDTIDGHHEKDNDDDDSDGIDNGLLTYKKFKKDFDSGSTNYRELQIIAKSLGLASNGKKQLVYNRIEGYFLSKKVKNNLTNNETNQQEEKKEEEQQQPQPQEKQYILTFKDVEPVENYFWKVFRNIVIFKHIFSNFKNKQYGYYDLIGCDRSYLNDTSNSMEIIIDNIKSNNNHQIIRNKINIANIIHKFKKNDEKTKSFYNLLFSRYSSTSTSSTIQFDENIDKWIQAMIGHVNFTALDQFIKFFKIDSEVIKKVMKIHIDPSVFGNTTYDKLKIYNYLKSINSLPTSHTLLPFISTDLSKFLSFDNKFKKLIKSYKRLIESTNLQERMEQQKQKEKIKIHPSNIKYYEKLNQIILELNEIQTSQFTNDQLNSTIKNLLNHTTPTSTSTSTPNLTITSTASNNINLKEIIKKYYKSICLFFYCTVNSATEMFFRKPLLYYLNFKKESVDKMYERVVNKWNGRSFDHQLFFQSILKDINIEKNEKFELISNVLDNKYVKTFKEYDHYIFFKAVFSSNDIELIDYFLKILMQQPNKIQKITRYPNIGKLIGNYCNLIDKKEILDFYFQNYRDESLLFDDQNEIWKQIQLELIEHYEYLMDSIGKRCKLDFTPWFDQNFLDRLNRAILKPSVYSIGFDGYFDIVFEGLVDLNIKDNKENSIINFLSNAQLKHPLDLKFFESSFNPYKGKMLTFIKFLFNNISKESIETKLKVINLKTDNKNFEEIKSKIELTTTLTATTTTTTANLLSPKKSKDVGCLTIGKTESFNFTISIRMLLVCLYNLDRVDDIIYLFDKLPEVLFNPDYFSIFTNEYCIYGISSSYYLELFINYFIENLNNNTINYLYNCLCIASKKGYTQIFKNIISSDQNSKYLLKIQTKSNQSSLFDSKLLNDIVVKSINSSNFELSNLLIDFIDFSAKDKNSLKMKILKSK
ncbi:SAP DNA-binding domain-containing protein [Dictyostelium discoideum AX4]|uniref:UPF0746 protein DDB_G0280787 n=1 Tax=Dictyostelium discoideum TaxID=44689 RepID=Y0787_DICDI|nr:SAP DNA-binding domain-containing protein [Dictyostelium discoideum AX4]Q54UV9.1 RecName: Full=UPF0746 protein DDB_G0280787 [Dictyostelium discoideum]EAL67051.1 SAP DNA-binding domain-containing protein [Dictyostelium discoideum AX4]|eukprot:XP_641028.1 SAP DNA-binding domain-containing protein [Dictyostelium discoideum AX4]